MARSLRGALGWLESRVGTRRGGAEIFALALVVFGVRSIALPVIPGRDFETYLRYYVQMWDWHSVEPMSMLYRTPLAPLVIGGTLDLVGGWGLEILMALLFAASIVAWTRTSLVFGPRPALVTAAALLAYPGYGILFHTPASEPVIAAAFAAWALAVARAWVAPSFGRFAVVGAATAATALARPAFQVLVLVAALPLILHLPWRKRLVCAATCASVVLGVLGSWTILNGIRYDDYTVARGADAFLPFYRAFTTDHIVYPDNGPASRELADAVKRELLPEEPYQSYGITLDEFFSRGGPREFEDVVGITDRLWGWNSDYAQMRAVGVEAVEAHPLRYASGVGKTILGELWKPLFVALPNDGGGGQNDSSTSNDGSQPETPSGLPVPSDGELIPAAHQGFFSTTPDGHIQEKWTSPVDHSRVFATAEMQQRYDEMAGDAARAAGRRAAVPRERVADAPVQPIVEALPAAPTLARCGTRRPPRPATAAVGPRAHPDRGGASRRRLPGARDLHDRRVRGSGRAGADRPRRGRSAGRHGPPPTHEQPLQERSKIRQPPGEESSSAHPDDARRFSSTRCDGPTTSQSAPSGTAPPRGTNTIVRRNPASQAG